MNLNDLLRDVELRPRDPTVDLVRSLNRSACFRKNGAPVIFTPDHFQGKPRFLDLGEQAFTLGGANVRVPLEKTGHLDGLIMRISGQTDITTAALVLLPRAPWNIFRSIRVSPPGRQKPVDVGGHAIRKINLLRRDFAPFAPTARDIRTDGLDANTGRSATLQTFPLGVGNDQAFELWLRVMFRRSATDPRGRIPMKNMTETVLYLTPNTEAELVTVPGNWAQDSLNVQVWQVAYDDPPQGGNVLPADTDWIVTYEEKEQVAAIGNNDVTIDPGGKILAVVHTLALNDLVSTSDDISGLGFKVDDTDLIEPNLNPRVWYYYQRELMGFAPPDGDVYFDFDAFADSDGAAYKLDGPGYEPSVGRWIHADGRLPNGDPATTQIESRITIPSGTTLGTTPRIFTTIQRLERVGR